MTGVWLSKCTFQLFDPASTREHQASRSDGNTLAKASCSTTQRIHLFSFNQHHHNKYYVTLIVYHYHIKKSIPMLRHTATSRSSSRTQSLSYPVKIIPDCRRHAYEGFQARRWMCESYISDLRCAACNWAIKRVLQVQERVCISNIVGNGLETRSISRARDVELGIHIQLRICTSCVAGNGRFANVIRGHGHAMDRRTNNRSRLCLSP